MEASLHFLTDHPWSEALHSHAASPLLSSSHLSLSLHSSHYGDPATMQCQSCDPSCERCVGPWNNGCLSCSGNFVFMRQWGRCLSSCPQGFYQDTPTKSCHKCHPTCRTCDGTMHPLSCCWLLMVTLEVLQNYPKKNDCREVIHTTENVMWYQVSVLF